MPPSPHPAGGLYRVRRNKEHTPGPQHAAIAAARAKMHNWKGPASFARTASLRPLRVSHRTPRMILILKANWLALNANCKARGQGHTLQERKPVRTPARALRQPLIPQRKLARSRLAIPKRQRRRQSPIIPLAQVMRHSILWTAFRQACDHAHCSEIFAKSAAVRRTMIRAIPRQRHAARALAGACTRTAQNSGSRKADTQMKVCSTTQYMPC